MTLETLHAPIYAALLGGAMLVAQIVMMLAVGMYRGSAGKSVGVDGDLTLERLVRRHGNLAENAAIFVLVLALYELLFGQSTLVLACALIFFIARVSHMIGFTNNAGSHLINAGGANRVFVLARMLGALFTALSSLVLGISLLINAVGAL